MEFRRWRFRSAADGVVAQPQHRSIDWSHHLTPADLHARLGEPFLHLRALHRHLAELERRTLHPVAHHAEDLKLGLNDSLPRLGNTARVFALLRSEEHTSELQTLMRISYAVVCLKQKTSTKN